MKAHVLLLAAAAAMLSSVGVIAAESAAPVRARVAHLYPQPADEIRDVTWRDCDILHVHAAPLDVKNAGTDARSPKRRRKAKASAHSPTRSASAVSNGT